MHDPNSNLVMMECTGEKALYNNQLVSCQEVEERGTSRGLTVYEIFRVIEGVPVFLEDHMQRLYHSLELEGVSIREGRDEMKRRIDRLIAANAISSGKIKLLVAFTPFKTREAYDLWLYFTAFDPPSDRQYREGVWIILCLAMREDPNAKVMHTEARRLADERIEQTGAYEALLVDRDGYITEGSRSNVFFVKGPGLVTPPDDNVLQGIARKNILRICREEGIDVEIRRVHRNELSTFEAVFLTGTTPKVLPVRRINQITFYVSHSLVRHLLEAYNKRLSEYIRANR